MRKFAPLPWRFRHLLLALTAIWAVQAISQESTPNLSGIWRMNPDASHISRRRAPTNRRAKIEQRGSEITITLRVMDEAGDYFTEFHYTIGSEDIPDHAKSPFGTKAQWKDGALALESNGIDTHTSETWTLSPDGQTLTYHSIMTSAMHGSPTREDTIVYEKQPEADWEPPRRAEEVYKNIQIFKGMPAPELLIAMRSFTRSLGVQCNFCHVQDAFDKDDKREKQTARKMILMARQINTDNFHGHMRVTCWTCHRGAEEPESAAK